MQYLGRWRRLRPAQSVLPKVSSGSPTGTSTLAASCLCWLCVILSRSPRIIRCAHSTRLPCTQLIGVRWHACPLSIILINSPNRGSVSFSLSSCSGEYGTYWTHTLSPTNTSIYRLAAILRLCIVSSSPSLPLLDPKLCLSDLSSLVRCPVACPRRTCAPVTR